MEQATSTVDKEFVFETARRAGLDASLDLLNYVKCDTVVKLCASIADDGGGSQQIIERVADRIESMAKEDREFAGLVASRCAKIIGDRTGVDAATAIRQSFEFLGELANVAELEYQYWSAENPYAFHVKVSGHEHLGQAAWELATDRAMDAMLAEFGTHGGVVDAYENAIDADPESEPAKLWAQALCKTKAAAMEGLPAEPQIEIEVIAYMTA